MPERTPILLDDRLLIEHILVGLPTGRDAVHTSTSWYYRACRAAAAGAGGHLSGPFARVEAAEQRAAVASLLALPDSVGLPDPRTTVPSMAALATRHPRLNLLNLEVAAAAAQLGATVWLSIEGAAGVLPSVLDAEQIGWRTVAIP